MREEWLEVSVTFDERHSYVASAPELRSPVVRPSWTNVCTRRKRTCGPQGGSPGLTQLGHAAINLAIVHNLRHSRDRLFCSCAGRRA